MGEKLLYNAPKLQTARAARALSREFARAPSLTRTRASFPTRPDASIPPASRRRAPEEIENSREETEEDPKGGLFGGGWSTSREWSSETRGGGAGGPTPELPFPFSLFFELDDD